VTKMLRVTPFGHAIATILLLFSPVPAADTDRRHVEMFKEVELLTSYRIEEKLWEESYKAAIEEANKALRDVEKVVAPTSDELSDEYEDIVGTTDILRDIENESNVERDVELAKDRNGKINYLEMDRLVQTRDNERMQFKAKRESLYYELLLYPYTKDDLSSRKERGFAIGPKKKEDNRMGIFVRAFIVEGLKWKNASSHLTTVRTKVVQSLNEGAGHRDDDENNQQGGSPVASASKATSTSSLRGHSPGVAEKLSQGTTVRERRAALNDAIRAIDYAKRTYNHYRGKIMFEGETEKLLTSYRNQLAATKQALVTLGASCPATIDNGFSYTCPMAVDVNGLVTQVYTDEVYFNQPKLPPLWAKTFRNECSKESVKKGNHGSTTAARADADNFITSVKLLMKHQQAWNKLINRLWRRATIDMQSSKLKLPQPLMATPTGNQPKAQQNGRGNPHASYQSNYRHPNTRMRKTHKRRKRL